jgi:uncharacterized protein YabE (DUF348 family)
MRQFFKRSTAVYGLAAAIFVLLSCVSLASYAQAASLRPSAGERLVTVHDHGQNKGILTRESTLRDAFREANIEIDPSDVVEPGLDEPLIASNYEVNIYRARPVTIVDGAVRTKVMSAYQTPKQIAAQANITLQDEDIATIEANRDMVSEGAGVQLNVRRAIPFTLVLYGTKKTAYTQEKTVGDMLKKKGIRLGRDDTLSIPASSQIQAGMTVELWRNGVQTGSEEQDVPFDTEKIQDADHEVGYRQVKTPGVLGKKTVTFEIEMKNGKEVNRKEIQSVVTLQPVKQVEIVGTKLANTFSGDFAGALARLRSCEGSYTSNTGNGYYGAYQYDVSTWANYGGYANASLAPPAVQDEKAWLTYQKRGWQPWPSCSRSQGLQDIYR